MHGDTLCAICTERPELRKRGHAHTLLDHPLDEQVAWELGLSEADNPDEWAELHRVVRMQ